MGTSSTVAPVPAVPASEMTVVHGTPVMATAVRIRASNPFAGVPLLIVMQEFNLADACGIEAKNRYRVSVPAPSAPDRPSSSTLIFCQESSDGCERVCCPACRGLTMRIHAGVDKQGPVVISMEKKYHCAMLPWPVLLHPGGWPILGPLICCAFADGGVDFTVRDGTGDALGAIHSPAMPTFLCNAVLHIADASGQPLLTMGPSDAQCVGTCCPCAVEEPLQVTRAASGEHVAIVTRKALDCGEFCGKTNRFSVDFGSLTDPTERMLLFAAGMAYDLQFWEFKG